MSPSSCTDRLNRQLDTNRQPPNDTKDTRSASHNRNAAQLLSPLIANHANSVRSERLVICPVRRHSEGAPGQQVEDKHGRNWKHLQTEEAGGNQGLSVAVQGGICIL